MNEYLEMYKKNNFKEIEEKYNIYFEDKELLVKAFIHSSYNSDVNKNYQRLEFLGDAVLQMVLSDKMYREQTNKREGEMSKERSTLVSEISLAYIIKKEGLEKFLILGKSLKNDVGPLSDSYISDTYESLIAAIYLDKGYKLVEKFIQQTLIDRASEILLIQENQDYKTKFQEIVQKGGAVKIIYKTEQQDKTFEATVFVNEVSVGTGLGMSKKKAEQMAAKNALEIMSK